MIVNIATKCGYTGQLGGLEKLHQKYGPKLAVIGIPSNDFMGQTPEGDKEVVKFCRLNYGVTFPIAPKSVVKGPNKIDLYKFLILKTDNEEVSWNFNKFLISKTVIPSIKVNRESMPSLSSFSSPVILRQA